MNRSRPGFVSSLVEFGSNPSSDRVLYVGQPNIPDREAVLSRVGSALDRRWLSNDGPMVREFEEVVERDLAYGIALRSPTPHRV